jgi:Cu+-exporting ATPase
LAAAIVRGAEDRGLQLGSAEDFESMSGRGVRGSVDDLRVALGNRKLLEDLGVSPDPWPRRPRRRVPMARP